MANIDPDDLARLRKFPKPLPTKLKILAHDSPIIYCGDDEMPDRLGEYNPIRGVIRINAGMTQASQVADVIIHEAFHALAFSMNLNDDCCEEEFVTRLATGTATIFRDNPEFVKWLQKALK